jgi:hypothetical protein
MTFETPMALSDSIDLSSRVRPATSIKALGRLITPILEALPAAGMMPVLTE